MVEETLDAEIARQSSKYVTELWNNTQVATTSHRQRMNDFYKQYRGIPNRKNYDGMANVFVNETLEAVESIVAQEVATMFSEPKFLLVLGRESTDKLRAKLIENSMYYYLEHINWKSKFIRSDRQKVKYGNCFVKVFWNFEEGLAFRRVKDQALPQVKKEVLRDHPDVEYIDGLDVAMDPGKPDIPMMDWFIIRRRVSWDYIKAKERQEIYSPEQVAKIERGTSPGSARKAEFLGSKQERLRAVGINYFQFDDKEYEILEYWGKTPRWWVDDDIDIDSPDAEEMVPGVMEVVNPDGPTLRLERNPYWHQEIPVAMGQHIPVDDEAWAMGACEIAESLQQELNDKRNQLLDRATEDIFPALIENRAADIGEIKKEPYFRIKSNLSGDGALQPLKTGGNFNEVVMMEGRVQQDIRNKTGATDPVQGIPTNKESTAFEVNTLQQRGSARINLSTIDFGQKFVKRVYRLMYKNVQQFVDKPTMIRILGKDGIKWERLTPEDVAIDADVIPKIPTDVDSRVIMRNQLIQFLGQLSPFFQRVKIDRIIRRIYDLFGFEDGDEIVPRSEMEYSRSRLTDDEEIQVLVMGQKVNADLNDNHVQKLTTLIEFMAQFEQSLKPEAVEAFKDKIRQHGYFMQVIQEAQAMAAQAAAQAGGAGGAGGKPKAPPAGAGQTSSVSQIQRDLTRTGG